MTKIQERLEYLRKQIQDECISTSEIVELQSLAEHIDEGDTTLLEWAGVPEFPCLHENTEWRDEKGKSYLNCFDCNSVLRIKE